MVCIGGKDDEQKATIATLRGIDELCNEAALEKGLTPRESEVLPYLAKGYDRGFIASELTISVETVEVTHDTFMANSIPIRGLNC